MESRPTQGRASASRVDLRADTGYNGSAWAAARAPTYLSERMPLDFAALLKDRIDLSRIPFSDRSARIMFFRGHRPPEPGERPAGFFTVRLAERWEKQQAQVGHYRQRRPVIEEFVFIDANGNPLPFELTTYPHEVIFDTPAGRVRMCFADTETLFFTLPPGSIGMRFRVHAPRGQADRRGGVFRGTRNVAYTTNATLASNEITSIDDSTLQAAFVAESAGDAGLLLNITPRLGFNRTMPVPAATLAAAAARWQAWFAAAPPVEARYQRQYYYAWWIMRAGLISPRYYMTREGMTPSKIHYVGVWQWDAFFHALAYRHVDARLAEDQVRLVFDHQRDDGMLPDAVHDEGLVMRLSHPVPGEVTKPPLAAWTVWQLYEKSGNREFLEEVHEPLVRWHNWWFEHSDDDRDGLCQYNHPFSSGLDDSPLWDGGMPVESPDLNTYLCLQQESLARIAGAIGLNDDARLWAHRAGAMAQRLIDKMWDEEAGVFWALRDKQPIRVLTPFSLYPLWTGRLPQHITARLIKHLTDPDEFWTRYPLPTVARSDPHYDPNQMWRGPTWVNINYLFIEGLQRCGRNDLAAELRDRTLDLVMQRDDIFEYYHPETGDHPPKAAPIFGWTSAVFIDLAIKASNGVVI
ncbi:MAG TPA: trehalase family glycosidase [Anaerolineae bacterium]|nr:trehalase family glycosidase [Anaerolineae bacterium]